MNSKMAPYLKALAVMAALALLPPLVKFIAPDKWELTAHIGIKILLNVGFGLCLWMMLQAGELSLGQGGFITIGGYTTGILVAKYNLISVVWLGYLAGALAAAVIALLLGYLIVHLKRIFFLLVTWSFAEMVHPVVTSFEHPFGGSMGIINIPPPEGLTIFGESWTGYYYLALIYGFAVLWIVWRIAGSKVGLITKSIGQNDTLVTFCGLYVRKYKVMIFVLGCFITGIGGGIMTSYLTAISPETFTFFTSLDIIMFNLIGGMGTITGPIVGAVILSGLNEYLFAAGYWRMVVYGLIIIFFITLLPGGMISLPAVLRKRFARKTKKQEVGLG